MKTAVNILLILCISVCSALAVTKGGTYTLLKGFYEYGLNEEVEVGCRELMEGASAADVEQIKKVLDSWQRGNMKSIKDSLVGTFGDDAKSEFEAFVAAYSKAESIADMKFFHSIIDDIGLQSKAADYNELRSCAAKEIMASSLDSASVFLTDIQTWQELGVMGMDRPPLTAWLLRDRIGSTDTEPKQQKKRSLRGSEASAGTFKGAGKDDDVNPLDTLSKMRDEKRAKSLKDAEAGMAMIAAERQAAEQEYAAGKLAKAKAEADAQVAQANKFAAAEAEAIEQRKYTWGNRLKNIVGATVTAAGGAFMGHVGAEVGRQAINAVFN